MISLVHVIISRLRYCSCMEAPSWRHRGAYVGYKRLVTSSRSYITNYTDTFEGLILDNGRCEVLKSNVRNPLPLNYMPELDAMEEVFPKVLSWYLQLVGILRWYIELGRIGIFYEA